MRRKCFFFVLLAVAVTVVGAVPRVLLGQLPTLFKSPRQSAAARF